MKANRLNEVVVRAYETSPFYKELYDGLKIDPYGIQSEEDLQKLPIISKQMVRRNEEKMISSAFDKNKLILERTSGSTGIPLYIYKSLSDKSQQGLSFWKKRKSQFGIDPNSKYCIFHLLGKASNINNAQAIEREGNCLSLCRGKFTDEYLHQYAQALIEFEPAWMFGGIQSWWAMAKFMEKNGYQPPSSIRFIESTGALISEECRQNVSEFFHCQVVDGYGCREVYGVGYECEYGNMHCLDDNVLVEIVEDGKPVPDGEEGDVVITSYHSKAMPFIRYLLGDRAKFEKDCHCPCGSESKVIKLSKGRVSDLIEFDDGRQPLSATCIFFAIDVINRSNQYRVMQFKAVQESYHDFKLYVEFDKTTCPFDGMDLFKKMFLQEMKKYDMDRENWYFYDVEDVAPSDTTGKLQYFRSKIVEAREN